MRVDMESGWEAHVTEAAHELLATRLGPDIAADAQRYAPVRTGRLRESIRHDMDGDTLIVEAGAPYAAYVEMGHRIAHGPRMREVGPKAVPPRPFLRPALYQQRGG